MKIIGIILVLLGICMLFFVGYLGLQERNKFVSPVPDAGGMKILFVTPAP